MVEEELKLCQGESWSRSPVPWTPVSYLCPSLLWDWQPQLGNQWHNKALLTGLMLHITASQGRQGRRREETERERG